MLFDFLYLMTQELITFSQDQMWLHRSSKYINPTCFEVVYLIRFERHLIFSMRTIQSHNQKEAYLVKHSFHLIMIEDLQQLFCFRLLEFPKESFASTEYLWMIWTFWSVIEQNHWELCLARCFLYQISCLLWLIPFWNL